MMFTGETRPPTNSLNFHHARLKDMHHNNGPQMMCNPEIQNKLHWIIIRLVLLWMLFIEAVTTILIRVQPQFPL